MSRDICTDCNVMYGHEYCSGCKFNPTHGLKMAVTKGVDLSKVVAGGLVFVDHASDVQVIPMNPERMSRDAYFMGVAHLVAKRGTCPRAEVGAVVVSSKNRILGTGYNGSPPGHVHCLDAGCKTIEVEGKTYCIRTIHAEVNAVLTVEPTTDSLTLYCTHHPCFECIKVLAAKGITSVVYEKDYNDPKWEALKHEYSGKINFRRI